MNDQVLLGYVHDDFVDSLWMASKDRLIRDDPRIKSTIGIHCGPKVDDGRNELFRVWLNDTVADYLFMCDTDMVLPVGIVDRLISHRKDIVGGLYFTGGFAPGMVRPHLYVIKEDQKGLPYLDVLWDYPPNSLVEVAGTGGGCLLVTRRCAKSMMEAMGPNHPMPWFAFGMHHNVPIGEDISFCLRAAKIGFPTYVDTGIVVPHLKIKGITEVDYVRSLNESSHPYYNNRERVPIYQEIVNGNTSFHSDKSGLERV